MLTALPSASAHADPHEGRASGEKRHGPAADEGFRLTDGHLRRCGTDRERSSQVTPPRTRHTQCDRDVRLTTGIGDADTRYELERQADDLALHRSDGQLGVAAGTVLVRTIRRTTTYAAQISAGDLDHSRAVGATIPGNLSGQRTAATRRLWKADLHWCAEIHRRGKRSDPWNLSGPKAERGDRQCRRHCSSSTPEHVCRPPHRS